MARGQSTFRQGDLSRALKATLAAGCHVQRVKVDKAGNIVVIVGPPMPIPPGLSDPVEPGTEPNEWDDAT